MASLNSLIRAAYLYLSASLVVAVLVYCVQDLPLAIDLAVTGRPELNWYRSMQRSCNPFEAELMVERNPAPATWIGSAYTAACYAAGHRDDLVGQEVNKWSGDVRRDIASVLYRVGRDTRAERNQTAAFEIAKAAILADPTNISAICFAGELAKEVHEFEPAMNYLTECAKNGGDIGEDIDAAELAKRLLEELKVQPHEGES